MKKKAVGWGTWIPSQATTPEILLFSQYVALAVYTNVIQ